MATDVSICSNASLMLGAGTINALDPPDATDRALLAANLYPQVREWVLRSHTWHAAKKYAVLAPDLVNDSFDYNFRFSFPDDWLRTLQVGCNGDPIDYISANRKFYSDEAIFYLLYMFNNKVEATYDSMLVHMLTLAMKAAMAYPLTKSQAVADSSYQMLNMELKRARSVDGQDEPPQTLGDFRLLSAGLTTGF